MPSRWASVDKDTLALQKEVGLRSSSTHSIREKLQTERAGSVESPRNLLDVYESSKMKITFDVSASIPRIKEEPVNRKLCGKDKDNKKKKNENQGASSKVGSQPKNLKVENSTVCKVEKKEKATTRPNVFKAPPQVKRHCETKHDSPSKQEAKANTTSTKGNTIKALARSNTVEDSSKGNTVKTSAKGNTAKDSTKGTMVKASTKGNTIEDSAKGNMVKASTKKSVCMIPKPSNVQPTKGKRIRGANLECKIPKPTKKSKIQTGARSPSLDELRAMLQSKKSMLSRIPKLKPRE